MADGSTEVGEAGAWDGAADEEASVEGEAATVVATDEEFEAPGSPLPLTNVANSNPTHNAKNRNFISSDKKPCNSW